jgi:L-glyceraldehyde 3-phosphate reductase
MFNRWIEDGLLDVLDAVGAGAIAFTALAQGLLTGKYNDGIPADSRAARAGATLSREMLDDARIAALRELSRIAADRGQTLAQLAVSWVLRDPRVTSVVVGASSVKQLTDTVAAVENTEFSADELSAIDAVAVDDPRIDLWRAQSELGPEPG